jgi:CRISPR-associated protein Csb2
VSAVVTALRHAGVRAPAVTIKVQREPFERRGARAEAFADGTRFAKERLWHVELSFLESIAGPLVIGDGRFLGLGLLAPVTDDAPGCFAFEVSGDDTKRVDGMELARALRRAVMSRVQLQFGRRPLGRFFSGHEEDGAPARSNHLAYHWDPAHHRLLIIAPHVLDHRQPNGEETKELQVLATALDGFVELIAGRAGRYSLKRSDPNEADSYLVRGKEWRSVCPYLVTRHNSKTSTAEMLAEDVRTECMRRGLPPPSVKVLRTRGVSGRGLEGFVSLSFPIAIEGPLVLGRTRYLGGGLFAHVETPSS